MASYSFIVLEASRCEFSLHFVYQITSKLAQKKRILITDRKKYKWRIRYLLFRNFLNTRRKIDNICTFLFWQSDLLPLKFLSFLSATFQFRTCLASTFCVTASFPFFLDLPISVAGLVLPMQFFGYLLIFQTF